MCAKLTKKDALAASSERKFTLLEDGTQFSGDLGRRIASLLDIEFIFMYLFTIKRTITFWEKSFTKENPG